MGNSPSRPASFAKPGADASGGPGSYNENVIDFGKNAQNITIGGKRP